MIFVRFVFTYMLALGAVEFLLLLGGISGDKEFFLGAMTAVPVTLVCWMLPGASAVTAYIERMRATGLFSHQPPPPEPRGRARGRAAHGSSLSR